MINKVSASSLDHNRRHLRCLRAGEKVFTFYNHAPTQETGVKGLASALATALTNLLLNIVMCVRHVLQNVKSGLLGY